MSSTKEIRNRIRAIRNTAKITGAMEMVAASKMKRAQVATLQNRPYSQSIYEVVLNLSREPKIIHPLLSAKKEKANKKLLIVITSDKGLCGSFNAAVLRKAQTYFKENPSCDVVTLGKKGQNYLKRVGKNIVATFTNFPIHPHILDIRPIIKIVTESFLKDGYDEVAVCYTDFLATLKQVPTIKTLLPLDGEHLKDNEQVAREITIKFEPSPKEIIEYLIPRILEVQFFQMLLESIASEQSARMVAMKNATEAAADLIDDLNLTYNSIRQANITQELAEISAGANINKE